MSAWLMLNVENEALSAVTANATTDTKRALK